ncbi:hypothetical protein QN277_006910 [Acacia crassicarpa]|uniref:RNase H type-1 domain-containing protein n=1 Tax=Acacia crassicarpa TaxID=499986 RepID=A0AAE1ITK3_9FABA|nr:hypothetical protein QN277_006910 [Acacia crassicarpa]
MGDCNATSPEEWVIVEGLQLAWNLGFKKIILESDADCVINMLLDSLYTSCSSLVLKAREMLNLMWEVDVRVIPSKSNRIADALTKRGISNSVLFYECPVSLKSWVDQECLGLNSPLL